MKKFFIIASLFASVFSAYSMQTWHSDLCTQNMYYLSQHSRAQYEQSEAISLDQLVNELQNRQASYIPVSREEATRMFENTVDFNLLNSKTTENIEDYLHNLQSLFDKTNTQRYYNKNLMPSEWYLRLPDDCTYLLNNAQIYPAILTFKTLQKMYKCNFLLRCHEIYNSLETAKAQFAIKFYAAQGSENFDKHLEEMINFQLDPSDITRNTAIDLCRFMKDVLNINDITLSQTTYRPVVEVLREVGINVSNDEEQWGYYTNILDFAEYDTFSNPTYNIVKFDNGDDYEIILEYEFTPRTNRNIQQQNEQADMDDDNEQFNEDGEIGDEQPSGWSKFVRKVKCFFKEKKLPRETRRKIKEERLEQIELAYQMHQEMQGNDEV
ncbi:MAG: hypothetical protein IJ481_00320 [Alphaproteobacteria bacterium]|nr:hypothetical protein [Alphaproteobacteria bacterium]